VSDYLRFQACNGFMNSLHSNNVTYDMFRNGFYLSGWDLTSSAEAGVDPYSIPSVRLGKRNGFTSSFL